MVNSHPETTAGIEWSADTNFARWWGLCRTAPEPLPAWEAGSRKKALTVSAKRPEAVVISVDQVLACAGQRFAPASPSHSWRGALSPPPIWLMRQAGAPFGHAHAAITAK